MLVCQVVWHHQCTDVSVLRELSTRSPGVENFGAWNSFRGTVAAKTEVGNVFPGWGVVGARYDTRHGHLPGAVPLPDQEFRQSCSSNACNLVCGVSILRWIRSS